MFESLLIDVLKVVSSTSITSNSLIMVFLLVMSDALEVVVLVSATSNLSARSSLLFVVLKVVSSTSIISKLLIIVSLLVEFRCNPNKIKWQHWCPLYTITYVTQSLLAKRVRKNMLTVKRDKSYHVGITKAFGLKSFNIDF
uniref:Uncharacterized protein n=1 Tax=Cacopsylla melanoneura TaxID=428564 RepID=A0A8D8S7W9_9HEMI